MPCAGLRRVLGWGKSIRLDGLAERLEAIDHASVGLIDRWRVRGELPEGQRSLAMTNCASPAHHLPLTHGHAQTPLRSDAYSGARPCATDLSIGVDAKAALLWARLAEVAPALFRLRLLNKLWCAALSPIPNCAPARSRTCTPRSAASLAPIPPDFARPWRRYIICGSPELFLHSYSSLSQRCSLYCDGRRVEIPKSIEGLMVLNTPLYGGGSDLWDEARMAPLPATMRHFDTR